MSDRETYIKCPLCDVATKSGFIHGCQAKEPLDGFPLKSVVQGRVDSPVPSNPAVQGTPDILAELRARAVKEKSEAHAKGYDAYIRMDYKDSHAYTFRVKAFSDVLQWLDELAPPGDNTAPDTTSGSAGVP